MANGNGLDLNGDLPQPSLDPVRFKWGPVIRVDINAQLSSKPALSVNIDAQVERPEEKTMGGPFLVCDDLLGPFLCIGYLMGFLP